MPLSGDIFKTDAAAGFDEGYGAADVGADARASFDVTAEFCHGIDLAVNADAVAEAFAELKLVWLLLGKAEGQAFAGVGAEAKVKIDVNLFEKAGVAVKAQAYAEASVAGRLGVGLTAEDLAKLGRDRLNNLEYDIFIAFVNELSGGACVWGKLAAAAMAKAHIEITSSLKDDDNAGFVIDAAVEAGAGAGGGYGFCAGFWFDNPKRFFLYTSERITRELTSAAKVILPPELDNTVEFAELLLPVCLNAAYELGQTSAKLFDRPDVYLKAFIECFTAQAQRYAFDKLTAYGLEVLNNLIRESLDEVAGIRFSADDRRRLVSILDAIIDALKTQELHSVNINNLVDQLDTVLDAVLPDEKPKWQSAISVTWFSLAAVEAIRYGFVSASASASASFLGLKTPPASSQVLTLQAPPAAVVEEFRRNVGHEPGRFTFGDAVEYLLHHSGAMANLPAVLPETLELVNLISSHTGIDVTDVFSFFLDASFGRDLSETELYEKLRDFSRDAIENYALSVLLPELRRSRSTNDDLILYLDRVVEPTFLLTNNFVFSRLDQIVAGQNPRDMLFSKSFSAALSNLLFKIFTANILVIFEIIYNRVLDSLHDGFESLADDLKSGANDRIIRAFMEHVARPLLPPLFSVTDVEPAAKELAFNLCNAMAVSFGPAIIAPQRRYALFTAINKVLHSIDKTDEIINRPNAVESVFEQFGECAYIPDPEGLEDLFEWNTETLAKYTTTVAPLITDAIGIFMVSVTLKPVERLETAAQDFVIGLLEGGRALWHGYQTLLGEFNRAVEFAEDKAREAAAALKEAADILKKKSTRDEILDYIYAIGLQRAADTNNPAVVAFYIGAFELARPLLNDCLKKLSVVADGLGDLLLDAADFPDLVRSMIAQLTSDITRMIEDTGISLPDEINVDDIFDAIEEKIRNFTPISDLLKAALRTAREDQGAQNAKLEARQKKDDAYREHETKVAQNSEIIGGPASIKISSPLPFFDVSTGKPFDWMYGRDLPVWILIYGANLNLVDPNYAQRVFIAVNGVEVRVPFEKWTYDQRNRAIVLKAIFRSDTCAFRNGINVIECSVVSGTDIPPGRKKVAFCMTLNFDRPGVRIDLGRSVFNSPANDHVTVSQECVAIMNVSEEPVSLKGWRLFDLKKHTYRFPDVVLKSQHILSIHTGIGNDGRGKLFWGRRRAVWNNKGDFVFLIDQNNVLSHLLLYPA